MRSEGQSDGHSWTSRGAGTAAADGHRAVVDGSVVTVPGTAPVGFAAALVELILPGHPIAGQLRTLMTAEHAGP